MKIWLLAATALAGGTATASLAQTTAPKAPTAGQTAQAPAPVPAQVAATTGVDAETDGPATELITVTGSRIRRAGFDTLEPALVISQEYLDKRGLTNVADALNELPGFGVGVTPEGGQSGFGVGQNFVNRFGLGTNRTLTVVNGRRFVSSNAASIFGPAAAGLQVDLNVIPQILVDRIENLTIGGAPTYGSDAIAGTVNIVLKKKFEGLEVRALTGLTERGDSARYSFQGLGGINFADGRGNITLAGAYDRTDGVFATQRERNASAFTALTNPLASSVAPGRSPQTDGRLNPNIPFNTGNADGIPNAVYVRDRRLSMLTPGGLLFPGTGAVNLSTGAPRGFGAAGTTNLQFNRDGRLVPYNTGVPFGTTDSSGGDGFNLVETAPITADLERITVSGSGEYAFSDNVRVFAEGSYYKANAFEIIDQPIYNATQFGGVSQPMLFSVNDPRLNPADRATLVGLGVTDFRLSRASRDIVQNNARGEQELYRGVIGLAGDFTIGDRAFNWEATANYGNSRGIYTANVLNQQNFVNAINVTTNAAGQIVCNPTPVRNVAPGGINPVADAACVPLDVFGEGRRSAAALAYVASATRTEAVLEQTVYNANIGGSPFALWAGDIGFNAGYERRTEKARFEPDAFQIAGRGRAVPILPTRGQFTTNEVFGELLVPLVSPDNNIPLVHSLTAEGKIRYVDNTVNGGFTTWTAGGRYQPFEGFEFRGNYTRSLRAPAVTELFAPTSNIFTAVTDPCDSRNVNGGAKPATRATNCAAFYTAFNLPPGQFQSIANDATVPGISGGDPNLANEVANSWTVGVVLRPTFLPGFRAAVDWNQIRISGPIANLSANQIATGCFDNDSFNTADVQNANNFCSRIRRQPNGQVVNDPLNPGVRTGFVNGAQIDFKGLTAEAGYNFDIGRYGNIDLNGSLFYLDTLDFNINGIVPDPQAGEVGDPRWSGQFNFGYTVGNFGWDLQANYTGKVAINVLDNVETRDRIIFDDHWLFNTTFSYKLKANTFARFTVTNLFDKQPPFPLNGVGSYDTLLRRFVVSLQYRF